MPRIYPILWISYKGSGMIGSNVQKLHSESLPVNRWPLNQDAKKRLQEAGEAPEQHQLYLVQLLNLGFERELPVPGPGQKYRADLEMAAQGLYDLNHKPADVMRWFLNNPNGPDQAEQNDTLRLVLEKATDWREAAMGLMEWFSDRQAAQGQ